MSNPSMPDAQARQLSALLEEFTRERSYVPEDAQAIDSIDELPLSLQARARDASPGGHWRAWAQGHRIWFTTLRPVRIPGGQPREISARISFYDQDGTLAASGVWLRRDTGRWVLYSVLGEEKQATCDEMIEPLALAS